MATLGRTELREAVGSRDSLVTLGHLVHLANRAPEVNQDL